jgi:hypothetical protein
MEGAVLSGKLAALAIATDARELPLPQAAASPAVEPQPVKV